MCGAKSGKVHAQTTTKCKPYIFLHKLSAVDRNDIYAPQFTVALSPQNVEVTGPRTIARAKFELRYPVEYKMIVPVWQNQMLSLAILN